jgi:F-type H+-transporting ATPase subunit delta
MKIIKKARREAKALYRSCQADGLLDEQRVRAVVQSVVEKKPRNHLPILTHFARLVRLDLGRRRAVVESAAPLSGELQQSVGASLGRRHGPGLKLDYEVNGALIGGMRIQVGSDVYDGSVRGRLDALKKNL